jgi:hypothetical protein
MMEHDQSKNSYNRFSLRVTATGPAPTIFGLGDMAVYANEWAVYANEWAGSGTTDIYLAEVGSENAGKELIVELFDVGDLNGSIGTDQLELYDGSDALAEYSWESDGGEAGSFGPCIIGAPNKRFNGQLLTITIPIAEDYTCTGVGCWYKIKYVYSATVNDTTTWSVYVVGNPIRLVE